MCIRDSQSGIPGDRVIPVIGRGDSMSEQKEKSPQEPRKGPMGRGMVLTQPVEKAKNFTVTIQRLVDYLRADRYQFIIVFVLAIASTLFSILGPKIMGMATTKLGEGIIAKYTYYIQLNMAIEKKMPIAVLNKLRNQLIPSFDFGYIGKIILLLIGLYIISALFSYIMSYIMASVSQRTVYRMRNDVKDKIDRLPLKYFDQRTHGEILSRVTNDMDNIATTLSLIHISEPTRRTPISYAVF